MTRKLPDFKCVSFPIVRKEIEAGLIYFYAATLLYKEFCCIDIFPEDELPSQDRQNELYVSVVTKLTDVGISK